MPNLNIEKKWTRWYPEKIFFKDVKYDQKYLYFLDKFKQEDFCTYSKKKTENKKIKKNSELTEDIEKTEAYNTGFKKGFLEGKKDNTILKNNLNKLFLDFENAFLMFEDKICSQLLQTVLTVSSYVIGKEINTDQSILLKHIKKIIDKESIFLKKIKFIIHPDNKILIEKILKDSLNIGKWKLEYDKSIDLNGCKVKSESGDLEATVDARWQELHRLFYLEEY